MDDWWQVQKQTWPTSLIAMLKHLAIYDNSALTGALQSGEVSNTVTAAAVNFPTLIFLKIFFMQDSTNYQDFAGFEVLIKECTILVFYVVIQHKISKDS